MKRSAVGGLVVALFSLAPNLIGQDVTIGTLEWAAPHETADQLPRLNGELSAAFPAELKKTPDIGWVELEFSLDKTGHVTAISGNATQPAYAQAVTLPDAVGRAFKPARRGETAIGTRVSTCLIFNPASAGLKERNATPRLLHATTVIDPARQTAPDAPRMRPEVVWASVSLDAEGKPQDLLGAPAELKPLLETAVRAWRFAPARKAGQAVAADVRVPFIVLAPPAVEPENRVQPRAVYKRPPEYPLAMRSSGLRGEVVVEFTVDTEGRTRDAVVIGSLNPGFNNAALEAIHDWKFEPGKVDGRPVNTRLQQAISFSLEGYSDGGGDGTVIRRRGDPSKLPAPLQYDTAPKLAAVVIPKYPYQLLREGVRGKAEVTILINSFGKVAFSKVVKADRPEFGYALQAAAELFEYQPALKNGQPSDALLNIEVDFKTSDERQVEPAEFYALNVERKHPERLLKGKDLDQRLKPTVTRSPLFPRSELKAEQGEAVVEFLVDQEGRVCVPRVISASAPSFGYAAVQAISSWRFEPPRSKGKPGVTRVTVPFEFKLPAAETVTATQP